MFADHTVVNCAGNCLSSCASNKSTYYPSDNSSRENSYWAAKCADGYGATKEGASCHRRGSCGSPVRASSSGGTSASGTGSPFLSSMPWRFMYWYRASAQRGTGNGKKQMKPTTISISPEMPMMKRGSRAMLPLERGVDRKVANANSDNPVEMSSGEREEPLVALLFLPPMCRHSEAMGESV